MLKSTTDFSHQSPVDMRVLQKIEGTPRQQCSCGLTAGQNKSRSISVNFLPGHAVLVVLMPENIRDKIWAVCLSVQPTADFLHGQLETCLSSLVQVTWNQQFRQGAQDGEEPKDLEVDAELDCVEHDGYPPVILTIFQALKRLAKGEVTDEIKRGEVVPPGDIDDLRVRIIEILVQLLDEEIGIEVQ